MPILLHTLLLLAATHASEPITTLSGTLSGTVVAADGKPVAGAIVVIAEGEPVRRSVVRAASAAAPQPPEVLAKATSDATGKFSISLPDETPESPLRRTRLTVWAHHVDSSLAVWPMDRDWPKAGLSLSLRLPPAAAVRFKVTDAGYLPAAHAQIAPLRVAGQLVPEVIIARLTARTDAAGKATLTGLVPSELETVRVESGASGAQWAGMPADRGKIALVRLAPVGQLRGQLTASEPRAIARKKVRFATWQVPGDEYSGGGLAEATTDGEGRFEIPALAAGSLTFEILEDGLPSPSRFNSTGDQRDPTSEPSSSVYLTAQATGPAIEAGETTTFDMPLRRAVRVTQQVLEVESHAPVAGARVWIRTGLTAGNIFDTDASGRLTGYALPGLVSSRLLRIPAGYYDPKGGRSPGTEVADSATPVSLKAIELARGAPLHGRVVDENQRPLAGAEITGFGESVGDLTALVHGWSNAQGEFTLDGVSEQATVSLWARHDDLTTVQPVLAGPQGAPATLIVGNEPGVSFDGRVVDAAGQPIAGAIVRVCAQRVAAAVVNNDLGPALFGASDRLITDAAGRFRTPPSCRPNATYWLEVEAPGMISARSPAIEPASWHTTHFDDVELRAMPRLRAVSGRVVDGQGNAVEAVEIWQSGDGPRRTRATSDNEGRFQLSGIYDGPAYLFARKEGFRLQGVRIAAADKTCQITIRQSDEPPSALTTLPPAMPPNERRALARELVEPLVPMLLQPVLGREHRELLRIVARANPIKGLELADTILGDPEFKSIARQYAALSLLTIDFDEALVIIALLDPQWRAETCVQGCYELVDAPLELRTRLLDEAIIHARSQVDPGQRACELGRIAECWFDLGRRDRGVSLLREGQALAESLPLPDELNHRVTDKRGAFAPMLARIDGSAALRLLEGFSGGVLDRLRLDVARSLADHDPAEAERQFRQVDKSGQWFGMRLAPVARMATVDAERAARLARSYVDPCEQAFALGNVAYALAAKDRKAAVELLDEAYGLLDHADESGVTRTLFRDAAITAAALLPVAEKIDPALVEGYFWRSLSLRQPWPTLGDMPILREIRVAELAAMIARYDRAVARDLQLPLIGQVSSQFMLGLAVTDPLWAVERVRAMPESSAPPARNRKLTAMRNLADWLSRSQRGVRGVSECVYIQCNLRDFETLDDRW